MNTPLSYTDIHVLLQLFVPTLHKQTILDKEQRIKDRSLSVVRSNMQDEHQVLIIAQKTDLSSYTEYDTIIDFDKNTGSKMNYSKSFHYITNPDGTMRWLFQENNLRSVLVFYAALNFRSKLLFTGLKLAAFFKLGKIIAQGRVTIYSNKAIKIDTMIESLSSTNYGLFMGTVGAERTPLLSILENRKVTKFVKIGLSRFSVNRINLEKRAISRFAFMDSTSFCVPKEDFLNLRELIVTTNIQDVNSKRIIQFGSLHAKALGELFEKTGMTQTVQDSLFWSQILTNHREIAPSSSTPIMNRIQRIIGLLKHEVDYNTAVLTTSSFGDFTPWNHYVSKNQLHIYDLECAQLQAPFLFDLFHYHFQSGIILNDYSFKTIYTTCLKSCELAEVRTIIERFGLDLEFYLKLYLMQVASEQIVLMQQQSTFSTNQLRQLTVWEQGLNFVLGTATEQSHRSIFIADLQALLIQQEHAFLKFDAHSLNNVPVSSDLDIAINATALQPILSFVNSHHCLTKVLVYNSSFMTTITCFFKDHGHLSLDLIHQFKRRSTEFMSIKPLLRSAQANDYGVRVPDLRFDLEYTLSFFYLNNAAIPEKYRQFFSNYALNDKKRALAYLINTYNLPITTWDELFEKQLFITKCLRQTQKRKQLLQVRLTIKNGFNYFKDTFRKALFNRSITITLSGVDGVGKSTVIEQVAEQIKIHLRRDVVLLRHRPRLLPILSTLKHGSEKQAETIAGNTKPGTGNNTSWLSSFVRFGYYFADYFLGQLVVFFRYKIRGKVVLYDRYYFDFINHPERSNIRLPKSFTKWFYRFISKPTLNVLLVADSSVIYQRKQELDVQTIERLTTNYRELFSEFQLSYPQSQYCTVKNTNLEETTTTIINAIQKVA